MSNVQILASYAAIVVTPCILLIVFQQWLNYRDDRYFQRQADKLRHPSMRQRSDVRVLHLTVDDFNGCDDCFTGWHGVKLENGRCLCCGFDLPASYPSDPSGEFAGYRKI